MNGAVLGAAFGCGVLLAARGWLATRPEPPLIRAMHRSPGHAPYPDLSDQGLITALRPLLDTVARVVGGRDALQRRLKQAGEPTSVDVYLFGQVLLAGGFAAAATALLALSGDLSRTGPAIVAICLALVGGLLVGDYRLTRKVAARRAFIAEQFPVAAQLLALLVAAGAPPVDAVGRVGRAVGGPLGGQLEAAARSTDTGVGFAAAMRGFADGTGMPGIERFVAGLISAIERGSPLSDILRAQALEASDEQHRALMVSAGKRDIAMLVPVVFAVLPTVVMVSLLPGAVQLGLVGG